jgi:hypothetical protein
MVEYRELRDREFYAVCRRLIAGTEGRIRLGKIVERAVLSPASSFFLSERQYGRIVRMKSGDVPRTRAGAELFYEIRRRYARIRADFPNMRAETIAKNFIACQEAPRFYISVTRGLSIYYSLLKEKRNGNKKRTD